MHLLIGLLIAAIVIVLLFRARAASRPASAVIAGPRSDRPFAFLSNGNIFVRARGGAVEQLHSPYVQEAIDRRERARERNAWKQGTSFRIAAGGGMRDFQPADRPIIATSATYERNGNLLYFLRDETIGALFRREAESGKELRLISRTNLQLSDLAPSPDGALLAAASLQTDGVSNIALLQADGSSYREVTGGDTLDTAPAWIPGAPNRLLFQSTGLARNEGGLIAARGNACILKLDMDSGSVSPILDDAGYDFLRPRVDPVGNLLFIRRPFRTPSYGMGKMLTDTLLFPFRLLRAVFHYLNFFSLMYSRKPLTSADNPALQADIKQILLQGRVVDAEKALRTARSVQGVPSLVPDNWELVRRDPYGNERVLATNVASYDFGADGTIVYSNGQGVFVLEQEGAARVALTDQLVSEVVAMPASSTTPV